MISTRFLPAVCGLVAVALVPTLIHSYSDSAVRDGRSTASIPAVLAGYAGAPSGRNATWGQRRFESDDWTERVYRAGRDEVTLTVVRSYDAKALYHHPELAVTEDTFPRTEIRRFAQRPEIPVFVLQAETGGVGLYALQYDDAFVEDPIRFQLRSAGEMLFSGRKAMTLFFLADNAPDSSVDALPSLGLFFEAIDRFTSQGVSQRP
ncbi:MAG: hypothetical protein HOP16_12195 [Acidobacteria bacterium]|nr:hypothetical protein [Acidobacteriota bacterium]